MNSRLIFMAAGSLLCVALIFLSPDRLAQAPKLFDAQFSSLSAFVSWAYVLATISIPIVCIVSLLRGWLAWTNGLREKAPVRLLLWPLAAVAVSLALFGLGWLIGT